MHLSRRTLLQGAASATSAGPQIIMRPLKGKGGVGPVITDRECTNCGRCIDVCGLDVFRFTHR